MTWRIGLLGPLTVHRDGRAVRLEELRLGERTLLRVLVSRRGHVIPRDELAEIVFGHLDGDRAAANLRVAASRLRSALAEPSVVKARGRGYALGIECAVDIEAFALLVQQGRDALNAGRFDDACNALAAGLALYRGDFAEDTDAEWVTPLRTRLRATRAEVADDLADAYLAVGRPRDAAAVAERALELEPTRESAYRRLMSARYAAGEQDAALAAYERCRRALSDELGVDPLPETMTLHERILRREPIATTSAGAMTRQRRELPFVARGPERIALAATIARSSAECVLALVLGEPGAGKTRLVEEALRARTDVAVLQTRCYELERDIAFAPLRGSLPGPVTVPDQAGRSEVVGSYAKAVLAHAPGRPLVWSIDDIQWADHSTIEVLHHLARRAPGARLALIATGRADELRPEHPLMRLLTDLRRDGRGERLALMPLTLDDVTSLARASGITAERARVIHERSGGNAFFASELIGAARRGDAALPETARDAVLARTHVLGPETRAAIEAAAVLGGRFQLREIVDVAALDRDAAARAVGELEAHDFARPRGATEYAVVHDLVREAVYDDIPTAVRRELHGRAIGAVDGARGADGASLICYHAELAGDRECAFACALQEGERALAAHAGNEAVANLDRALAQAGDTDAKRRCLTLRAQAKRELGLVDAAEADAAAAATLG